MTGGLASGGVPVCEKVKKRAEKLEVVINFRIFVLTVICFAALLLIS